MGRTEIIAALGPTNTGKTHRAIARMMDHESGMMGLPLRLLAREIYDRVTGEIGRNEVALITGEEKLIPRRPRYFICTVEAMPLDREVDFLAVDEIQLAGHHERGHVFTARLLHARGRKETWFMGSDGIEPLIAEFVPTAQIRRFPRLSALRAEGSFSLGSLPRRSAVVAFSANRVYELAEKLRARKGGAAVVLGALSPRARNAQVAMYQSGEVDYLVATDAIGMGLNLDIDRVAFADTQKFDGRGVRPLDVSEISQIAGRAGRYTRDGGFGTFERQRLSPSVERAIEQHRVPSLKTLVWRNQDLDFSSPRALLSSLAQHPPKACLQLVEEAEDTMTLESLLRDVDVAQRLGSEEALRLLWDVCQIPDYRRLLAEEHTRLLGDVFKRLTSDGIIRSTYLQEQLSRLETHTGEIDAIMNRIAFVRTWTYVACHGGWTEDDSSFQERTRQLEDQLSDALHRALVERFVRTKKQSRTSKVDTRRPASPAGHGTSNHFLEQLASLRSKWEEDSPVPDIGSSLIDCGNDELSVTLDGSVHHRGTRVAQLRPGHTQLQPEIVSVLPETGAGKQRQIEQRLRAYARDLVGETLGPLLLSQHSTASPALRGIVYQLREGLGCAPAAPIRVLHRTLEPQELGLLTNQGFVLGRRFAYLGSLLTPAMIQRRALLVRTHHLPPSAPSLAKILGVQSPLSDPQWTSRPSFEVPEVIDRRDLSRLFLPLGYAVVDSFAVRVDLFERILQNAGRRSGLDLTRWVASTTSRKRQEAAALVKGMSRARRRRGRNRLKKSPKPESPES